MAKNIHTSLGSREFVGKISLDFIGEVPEFLTRFVEERLEQAGYFRTSTQPDEDLEVLVRHKKGITKYKQIGSYRGYARRIEAADYPRFHLILASIEIRKVSQYNFVTAHFTLHIDSRRHKMDLRKSVIQHCISEVKRIETIHFNTCR